MIDLDGVDTATCQVTINYECCSCRGSGQAPKQHPNDLFTPRCPHCLYGRTHVAVTLRELRRLLEKDDGLEMEEALGLSVNGKAVVPE